MDIKRPSSKLPSPKNARLAFKGKIFDVYQWEQKMFDGSRVTFEKIKRTDTANVIPVMSDGKVILLEQEQPGVEPFVGVAGGRIDKGENPLEAAKRELLEETGYYSDRFILWDTVQPEGKIDWACYTFVAKGCKKIKEQNTESGEKIKLIFVSFDEFMKIAAQDNFRDSEVTLKLFKLTQNPEEMEKARKLFEES